MNIRMSNKFSRDEGGSITIFIVLMFVIMVLGSGMAIDFMRYESERASLQDAIDRGVLSTASLRRTGGHEEVEAIVDSYLLSNSIGARDVDTRITSELTPDYRRVNIVADYTINTFFLKLAGINTLTIQAKASAREARNNIEISMVLDVTSSMSNSMRLAGHDNINRILSFGDPGFIEGGDVFQANPLFLGKMGELKSAADAFVDLILTEETKERTSISMIPFATQVSIGEVIASQYNLNRWHDYSLCVRLNDSDFRTTDFDPTNQRHILQHNPSGYINRNTGVRGISLSGECHNSDDRVPGLLVLSNSAADLHRKIDELRPSGFTNTSEGLKWGVSFLDPSTQAVVAGLTEVVVGADGEGNYGNGNFGNDGNTDGETYYVDPTFAGRPAAYADTNTMKFLVFMTDGSNSTSSHVPPAVYNHEDTADWRSQENADYWATTGLLKGYNGDPTDYTDGFNADTRTANLCEAAKEKGIIVYAVAFDVREGGRAHNLMQECATDPAKFYNSTREGINITDAFRQIAHSIRKLRLID